MKKVTLLIIALLTVGITNAQWGKKVKGNGKVITEERSTGDYNSIAIAGWFDVALVDGREGDITLEGEENLLEYIVTEVKNGKLSVKVKKGYYLKPSSWDKGNINVTIPFESINAVTMSGSGDIVGKKTIKAVDFNASMSGSGDMELTIEATNTSVSVSGSGDMELEGASENLEIQISGSGDIKAYGLSADNVTATVSGSADIKVTANEMLKARVSGSGDIYYKGNPKKVDSKTSGSGDISRG
ncbi:MAG: DUF2807 domain-containing protein [Eudoraea sp.]|nr:DUF2807 domain-containing protein [Eudoraea sp.]